MGAAGAVIVISRRRRGAGGADVGDAVAVAEALVAGVAGQREKVEDPAHRAVLPYHEQVIVGGTSNAVRGGGGPVGVRPFRAPGVVTTLLRSLAGALLLAVLNPAGGLVPRGWCAHFVGGGDV